MSDRSWKLHAEAGVRFVGTVALHGFLVGHAGQRCRNLHVQHLAEQILHKALCHLQDVLHVNERHLQVNLGEFRLAVCTQILVTEAAGNLDVPIHAGNHQQLLVDLGDWGSA